MSTKKSGTSMIGVVLIAAGILIFLGQFEVVSEHIFLYLVGLGFLFTYYILGGVKRYGNIGFLIPGTCILGLSIFVTIDEISFFSQLGGGMFFICLSFAFWAVYLLHTRHFTEFSWGDRNWPIFPGLGLIAFGTFVILSEKIDLVAGLKIFEVPLPYILIGLGIIILLNGKRKGKGKEKQGS